MDRVEESKSQSRASRPKNTSACEQNRWNEQIDRDSSVAKLDFLFEEAENESAHGLLREWPSDK
jgi:hypothetical protein